MIKRRFEQSFPQGSIESVKPVDNPDQERDFHFGIKFREPLAGALVYISITPFMESVSFEFMNYHRKESCFGSPTQSTTYKRYDEKMLTWCSHLRELLAIFDVNADPLDNFIKDTIKEIDIYYTLQGIHNAERRAMWDEYSKQEKAIMDEEQADESN
jgi:hypothetical protein